MSPTMIDYFLIPLNPPLVVSGRVEVVDERDGEQPFDFEHGLAVAISENWVDGEDTADYSYKVVMPSGRVYEVDNTLITSAEPWTPADHRGTVALTQAATQRARHSNPRGTRSAIADVELANFANELWEALALTPMTNLQMRRWAGSDARQKLITHAIRDLNERDLIARDRRHLYWAKHQGQLLPANRADEFAEPDQPRFTDKTGDTRS